MDIELLIQKARVARDNAYAPYSGIKVGAALLTTEGEIFTGCNVENVSYGLTLCAERVAVANALTEGKQDFEALLVLTDRIELSRPCGACRQVLNEFCRNEGLKIILADLSGKTRTSQLHALLPLAYGDEREAD